MVAMAGKHDSSVTLRAKGIPVFQCSHSLSLKHGGLSYSRTWWWFYGDWFISWRLGFAMGSFISHVWIIGSIGIHCPNSTGRPLEIIVDPDSFNAPGAKLRIVFDSVDRVTRSEESLGDCGSLQLHDLKWDTNIARLVVNDLGQYRTKIFGKWTSFLAILWWFWIRMEGVQWLTMAISGCTWWKS